jgi:hypothetical protein
MKKPAKRQVAPKDRKYLIAVVVIGLIFLLVLLGLMCWNFFVHPIFAQGLTDQWDVFFGTIFSAGLGIIAVPLVAFSLLLILLLLAIVASHGDDDRV